MAQVAERRTEHCQLPVIHLVLGPRLDRLSSTVFRRYRLSPDDVTRLRERFADWPRA